MRVPAGHYDARVVFQDGAAPKEIWQDNQDFTGSAERTMEVGIKVAAVTIHLTNNGQPITDGGRFDLHPAGHHDHGSIRIGTFRNAAGAYPSIFFIASGILKA